MIDSVLAFLWSTFTYVINLFISKAHILIFAMFVAAALRVYLDPLKLKQTFIRKSGTAIIGSVALGALSPLCACGSMAVIVAMMTTVLPWGPIMAFLTSSPIMGPNEFVIFAGIVNFRFAIALTISSIGIGIFAGYITHIIDKHTKFLKNQIRLVETKPSSSCSSTGCGIGDFEHSKNDNKLDKLFEKYKVAEFLRAVYNLGVKRIIPFFALFATIGYAISQFVPAEIMTTYLGTGNHFAVPLLSLLGLPLYVGSASAAPLMNILTEVGVSQGALLSFIITGSGTSIAVIVGLLTVMKRKAILLYVVFIFIFSILAGYLFDLYLLVF